MGNFRIAVDCLPALPGKSGAVGAYRNLMKIAPKVNSVVEFDFFVTKSQNNYYKKYIDVPSDRIRMHIVNIADLGKAARMFSQNFIVPMFCVRNKIKIHYSMNPEPIFNYSKLNEIFNVVDLQYYDVPDEFATAKVIYRKIFGKRKAKKSVIIFANSTYTKEMIVKYLNISDEKVYLQYESFDHEYFNTDVSIEEAREILINKFNVNYPYIIYVSSFRPYKNHINLIDAFNIVKNKYKEIKLVLIGNDINNYEMFIKKHIVSLKMDDNIVIYDYIHHDDLKYFYRCAILSVYPSKYETFGIPPLEAMACGIPNIVSNKTAVPEISGGGAVVINPDDIDALAESMISIIDNDEYRRDIIKKGLIWCNRYNWCDNIRNSIDIISNKLI